MDRYYYQLLDVSPDENKSSRVDNKVYCIFDRKISSVKEIAVCEDIGFVQTIVQALNGVFKSDPKQRRS